MDDLQSFMRRIVTTLLVIALLLCDITVAQNGEHLPPTSLLDMKANPFVLYDIRTDDQDRVDPSLWGGVTLRFEAGKLGDKLRDIANEDLGVEPIQAVFDSIKYVKTEDGPLSETQKLGESITSKLASYRQILLDNKRTVENLYTFHQRSAITNSLSCCQLNQSFFSSCSGSEFYSHQSCVSLFTACDLLPYSLNPSMFNPGRNLTKVFSNNAQISPALKWQYFISADGIQNEFPAHVISPRGASCQHAHTIRHRDIYVRTVAPEPKNVVIMVDTSSVLSRNQLATAKELAKQVLLALSPQDKVTVLALSNTVQPPPAGCMSDSLASATGTTKQFLLDFINGLIKSDSQANHTLGMRHAFSVLPPAEGGVVFYMSRGLMNSIAEAGDVLAVIAQGNTEHSGKVHINAYALIDDGKPVMYEKTFLEDIAKQNFAKYKDRVTYTGPVPAQGDMVTVCCPEVASVSLNSVFLTEGSTEPEPASDDVVFSLPYNDIADQGLVVSVSARADADLLLGVVGIDIALEDLVEEVAHSCRGDQYAFLVTSGGEVISHPTVREIIRDNLRFPNLHLAEVEHHDEFPAIAERILTEANGTAELILGTTNTTIPIFSVVYIYSWYGVANSPYIVVMKSKKHKGSGQALGSVTAQDLESMVYHRLDLGQLPAEKTCLHFQQLASFSTSALFLSPQAFEKPYEHVSQPETKTMIQNYIAYLSDSSTYISKPGLKKSVKNDALAISRLNRQWLTQYHLSSYRDFIIRRYVATPDGAMRMFPAALTRKRYEPSQSHWYRQATRLPGRIMLTRPYVDTAGAGFIVTVSHSIYEGRDASLHTPNDPISAVVGADFPVSFFQRLVLDIIPVCGHKQISCFLIDDRGYLISHPSGNAYSASYEDQHITRVAPLIANDILEHKGLVTKKVCYNLPDRTIQRYYHFNTSLVGTLTNLKAGEQCIRYQLSLVAGTNAFIVMVNETCAMKIPAFCPCSTTDRLCLNCQRMEQSECECPCECPAHSGVCEDEFAAEVLPACDLFTETNVLFKLPSSFSSRLAQCLPYQCRKYSTKQSCMGVVGCSWCELEPDGVTELSGFCDIQQVCFGGVLGARTPYNDQVSALGNEAESTVVSLLRNTPVGPVAGAILGTFLVLALAVYCYRHNMHRHNVGDRMGGEVNSPEIGYNQEQEGYIYHELPAIPGPSAALSPALSNVVAMEAPHNISPYRVNVNYRPPRPAVTTTESSDHGYSTMTAHEEADSSSTSCIEAITTSKTRHSIPSVKIYPPPKTPRRSRGAEHKRLLPECTIHEQEGERVHQINAL